MSYCRFAWDNSDVYIYEGSDGLICAGCRLADHFVAPVGDDDDAEDRKAGVKIMLTHLRMHQAKGHVVPMYAPAELAEEVGLWTFERVVWNHVITPWCLFIRKVWCRRFGHKAVPALISKLVNNTGPIRRCARCREGNGFLTDDGIVRWLGEEIREERKAAAK